MEAFISLNSLVLWMRPFVMLWEVLFHL